MAMTAPTPTTMPSVISVARKSWYEELRDDRSEDEQVRQLTLRSFKRLINQLKEEIARYEAHHAACT